MLKALIFSIASFCCLGEASLSDKLLEKDLILSPCLAPNGEELVMSIAHQGHPASLHIFNLKNHTLKKITNLQTAIAISPSYSPQGQKIVYSSDKSGVPSLYIKDLITGNGHKISHKKGEYLASSWSPKGNLIAFIYKESDQFYIGVMDPQGKNEEILTQAFFIDGLSWASNGQSLLFSRQLKPNSPFEVCSTGLNKSLKVIHKGNYTYSQWSPKGDTFAYIQENPKNYTLGLINLKTQKDYKLAQAFFIQGLTWIQNGKKIVYTSQPQKDGKFELNKVNAD